MIYFPHIKSQGAIVVNSTEVVRKTKDIIHIVVDLKSKYASYDGSSFSDDEDVVIFLSAQKRTIKLHRKKSRASSTLLALPDTVGWQVFAASLSKCTLRIALEKRRD